MFYYVGHVWLEVVHSFRSLARAPVFTCTVLLTLTLTIGAGTAVFTVADTLLFKPLPVKDPKGLVTFALPGAKGQIRYYFPLSFARQLRSVNVFSDIIGINIRNLSFEAGERTERITGEVVTPNFFSVLGLTPARGQWFSANVISGNWAPEAVLSYSFWKKRFHGDPTIVGKVIRINTYPFTIIGVAPASFLDVHQGQDPDVRIPVLPPGQEIPQLEILGANQDFDFIARLASNVNQIQAQAAVNIQFKKRGQSNSEGLYHEDNLDHLLVVPGERGWPDLEKDYTTPVVVLFVLILIAIFIACTNIAGMMMVRASVRHREFAIRLCLGASRFRLISQILLESLALSWCSGLAGLAAAYWIGQLLLDFLPQRTIRMALDLQLTIHSIIFTFSFCTLAALLFGLGAALQTMPTNLIAALKENSGGSIRGIGNSRKTLVVVQIVLSLTLLAVGGLFIHTVVNLYRDTDYPYATNTLTFTIQPQQELYSPERIRSMMSTVVRNISSVPGVQAVGLADNGPFTGRQNRDLLRLPGHAPLEVTSDVVSPGFLNAIGLNILAGRDFTASDEPRAARVVILSQSAAQMLFPGQDPIGRHVQFLSARGTRLHPLNGIPDLRIIGVVRDVHYYDIRRLTPAVFFTFQADPPFAPTVYVRLASGNPDNFMSAIKQELDVVDMGFPVFNVRTLADRMHAMTARERMIADLSSSLGLISLFLVGLGIYGIMAYSVARRTREFGVRIALGSTQAGIVWLVWREILLLVNIGVIIGLSLAISASKILTNRLYGVSSFDLISLLTAALALLTIATAATCIPATRASRIEPAAALRSE